MLHLKYILRLIRSVLWQRPLRFVPPCDVDLSSHLALVTGGGSQKLEYIQSTVVFAATNNLE